MPEPPKFDLFKPQQPNIPGVLSPASLADEKTFAEALPAWLTFTKEKLLTPLLWVSVTVAGIAASGGAMLWLNHRPAEEKTAAIVGTSQLTGPENASSPAKPAAKMPVGPGAIATSSELEKPWSAKRFLFRNPISSDLLPAIVVHVPNGDLWAISLREPFGTCDMEYVTDLKALKTKYNFEALHPMVADACNGGVFDLATYGNGPNGMVRGEIVQGTAVRPPVAIKIERRGNEIVATRME